MVIVTVWVHIFDQHSAGRGAIALPQLPVARVIAEITVVY